MDLNDFIFFLQGKYRDKTDLNELRGKRVNELTEELIEMKKSNLEKDSYVMNLYNENQSLNQLL